MIGNHLRSPFQLARVIADESNAHAFLFEHTRLTEMEINPLLARAEGRGVAAADALAALR
ncbi:MAG TPA: hypothetical protein VMN03_07205 [Burkholderiales bacterium]|nr:hypothetical protein [Burkholderiales bacterium]